VGRQGGGEWLFGRRLVRRVRLTLNLNPDLNLTPTRPGLDRAASPLDHEQIDLQPLANEYDYRDAEYESEPEAEPSQDALNRSRHFHPENAVVRPRGPSEIRVKNSAARVHSASFAPPRFNVFRSGRSTRYFFLSHPAIAAAVPEFVASGTLCTSHTRINAETSGSCG
jgi:hypothetical protein